MSRIWGMLKHSIIIEQDSILKCYGCWHVLWSSVDDSPTCAYLRAVLNCTCLSSTRCTAQCNMLPWHLVVVILRSEDFARNAPLSILYLVCRLLLMWCKNRDPTFWGTPSSISHYGPVTVFNGKLGILLEKYIQSPYSDVDLHLYMYSSKMC